MGPGATIAVRGRLSRHAGKRPVQLVARLGSATRVLARVRSDASGRFVFPAITLQRRARLTAVVPRVRSKRRAPRVEVKDLKLVPLAANGVATVLPPLAQPGRVPLAASDVPVVAVRFTPAVRDREVILQRLTARGWRDDAVATQDATGQAVFAVPAGRQVRAVSLSPRGGGAVTNTVTSRSFTLNFDDDFGGSALNPVWGDQLMGNNAGGRSCSRPDPSMRGVSDGVLNLRVGLEPGRAEPCSWQTPGGSGTHPYLLNSQIATEHTFRFQYGYAAARMRLHRDKGMHSCFWVTLLPDDQVPGDPSKGVEIDVSEWFGDAGRRNGTGVGAFVWEMLTDRTMRKTGSVHQITEALKAEDETWWNSYHVFSVEWTPTEYVFRVDGREYWRTSQAISHTPEYLVLSLLTSDFELDNLTPATMSQATNVDWVRVWAL